MAEIGCKKCTSPDCKGCNTFILETALKQGKFDTLMDGNRTIHIAADVRENVRGEWIPKNSDGSWRVDTCSVCRKDTHYVRYAPPYDYCPNCGAKMEVQDG